MRSRVSDAVKIARLERDREVTLAMLRFASHPIVLLVGGCVAAEMAEKSGLLSSGWSSTIQGAMLGMAVASAIKEAGAVGGMMAGVGAAGGSLAGSGWEKYAMLAGLPGQAAAIASMGLKASGG